MRCWRLGQVRGRERGICLSGLNLTHRPPLGPLLSHRSCHSLTPLVSFPPGLREEGELSLQDRVFANEMCIAVHRARHAYDHMMFREALKIAAYDLGAARDVYR